MSPTLFIIILTLIGICVVFEMMILISYVFRVLCIERKERHRKNSFFQNRLLSFSVIMFSVIMGICDFYHMYLGVKDTSKSLFDLSYDYIMRWSKPAYFISVDLLYVTLMHRVYIVFKGSIYTIHPYVIILFVFLLVCIMALQSIHVTFFLIDYGTDNKERIWPHIPLAIGDLMIHIMLLTLFIKKLRLLIYYINEDNETSVSDSLSNNARVYKLLKLMAKMCVLTVFIVVFNQLFPTCAIYVAYDNQSDNSADNAAMEGISYLFRNIAGFVNCLTMFLIYKVNQKMYYCLCFWCDNCFYKKIKQNVKQLVYGKHTTYTPTTYTPNTTHDFVVQENK